MPALDLIEITAASPRSTLELLPGDDERFHVVGGNDQIVARMISALPPACSTAARDAIGRPLDVHLAPVSSKLGYAASRMPVKRTDRGGP
jgi:hypothetical protein